jgi:hypothetical protein
LLSTVTRGVDRVAVTTEAVISQIPEEHKHAAVPGGGMGAGRY